MSSIKGYKVFHPDWTCRGFQYKVGKIYEQNIDPKSCKKGFHFCKEARDCFTYYSFNLDNKVAEIIAHNVMHDDRNRWCTNKIEIVREVSWNELLRIMNIGRGNDGSCNIGDENTGDRNVGTLNTGHRNIGNINTGAENSGNLNIGNDNAGHVNIGNDNTGHWNKGSHNAGNKNVGDKNAGDCNKANFCTGDFNIVDHETGCFCTTAPTLRFFDVDSGITYEQWRQSEAFSLLQRIDFRPSVWIRDDDMTEEEKTAHPEYKTTGGYLKVCDMTHLFVDWWKSLNDEEKVIIKSIPNFSSEKFFKITGILVE